jgi:hypothetical protein
MGGGTVRLTINRGGIGLETASRDPLGRGPIERKLSSRLHFKLFGRWPRAVADERLGRMYVNYDPTNVNAILAEVWGKDQR